MEILAQRLKSLMEKRGLDERKLAKKTGIDTYLIKGYLEAYNIPSIRIVIKLANYFSCTVDYLVGLSDKENEYWINNRICKK